MGNLDSIQLVVAIAACVASGVAAALGSCWACRILKDVVSIWSTSYPVSSTYSRNGVGSGACSDDGVACVMAAGSWPCAETRAAAYRAAKNMEELASFILLCAVEDAIRKARALGRQVFHCKTGRRMSVAGVLVPVVAGGLRLQGCKPSERPLPKEPKRTIARPICARGQRRR